MRPWARPRAGATVAEAELCTRQHLCAQAQLSLASRTPHGKNVPSPFASTQKDSSHGPLDFSSRQPPTSCARSQPGDEPETNPRDRRKPWG